VDYSDLAEHFVDEELIQKIQENKPVALGKFASYWDVNAVWMTHYVQLMGYVAVSFLKLAEKNATFKTMVLGEIKDTTFTDKSDDMVEKIKDTATTHYPKNITRNKLPVTWKSNLFVQFIRCFINSVENLHSVKSFMHVIETDYPQT